MEKKSTSKLCFDLRQSFVFCTPWSYNTIFGGSASTSVCSSAIKSKQRPESICPPASSPQRHHSGFAPAALDSLHKELSDILHNGCVRLAGFVLSRQGGAYTTVCRCSGGAAWGVGTSLAPDRKLEQHHCLTQQELITEAVGGKAEPKATCLPS